MLRSDVMMLQLSTVQENYVTQKRVKGQKKNKTNEIGYEPIQHFDGSLLVAFQELRQMGVVITDSTPANDPGQIIARSQRQYADLALFLLNH